MIEYKHVSGKGGLEMNDMRNNRPVGLLFIILLSFFLTGALWTAAEAVDVTINGAGFSTSPYQLATGGLNIDSVTGNIGLTILSPTDTGVINGNVDTQGSMIYVRPAAGTTGAALYMPIDQGGIYSFTNLAPGTYVVFPVLEGKKFTPAYSQITLTSGQVVNNVNFTGGPAVSMTYSIYGTVSGASGSVNVTLAGAASQQTSTTGSYIFSGLAPGSYTVAASAAGFSFNPQSSPVTISNSNVRSDFTASVMTYKISGYVKDASNVAIAGVAVSSSAGACSSTDANGYYSCNNLSNGTYTISASKSGYSITPTSASVTISNADKTQNFTAATAITYTISGTVSNLGSGANATISLSGAATKSTTTVGGAYSFTGLLTGNYTVTPTLSGYTFSPTSSSFTLSSDIAKNFTASVIPPPPPVNNAITINNMQEKLRNDLPPSAWDLYVTTVPVPGNANFVNATKDWVTRRDMIVMYGGAACDKPVPTVSDYNAIIAGTSNRSLPLYTMTGETVNNRTFYYNFQDVMNQSLLIGRSNVPAAPAGCYYILIYNVSSSNSDYSLYFSTLAR